MNKRDLRKISLEYRTLSSQMLKIDSQEEVVCIQAFYDYITKTELIHNYILSCHTKDYDFEEIFKTLPLNERLVLPSDQKELVDYEYQLIKHILTSRKMLFWFGQHYSSSNHFSDMITAFMRKAIEPFVVALRSFLEMQMIDSDDMPESDDYSGKRVFLSYCQKDSVFADLIDERMSRLFKTNARISRDIRDVTYHESFGRFMRSIQKHDFVIVLVSDNYLKSRNCMFEVMEAIKDNEYKNRIVYFVLQEKDKELVDHLIENKIEANIYTTEDQTEYVLYWKKREEELQSQIEAIGNSVYAIEQIKEQIIVKRILLDLPEFLTFIRDYRGLSLEEHLSENFISVLKFMGLEQS